MTIDEAIKHCEEVVARYEKQAANSMSKEGKEYNCSCAAEHRQLAEWLTELKNLREENKVLISECDRLIKEKGELLKKSEQIAEYKRLLKAAVEDMNDNNICFDINACNVCANNKCISCDTFKWRYLDEALKLIGGETDEQI